MQGAVLQLKFAFLARLPAAELELRARRAFRPHLRTRSVPGAAQLVFPLCSPPGAPRYVGIEACEMEDALRAARAGEPGALAQLMVLTRPELREVARALNSWDSPVSEEDLVAEAELRLLTPAKSNGLAPWQRFEPGRERGRTLWPKYARMVARQAMGRFLSRAPVVAVTEWGLKQARRRTRADGEAERPSLAMLPEESLATVAEDECSAEERAEQALAVVQLARLPVRERVAVAGPLGFLPGRRLSDGQLARHLKCSLNEVLELRERGLERLREAMGA